MAPVDWLPEVALAPDHPPEAEQEVAFVDDQVSVDAPLLATDNGFAASVTVGTGTGVRVVKFQLKLLASALPAASFATVLMVAVYCVLLARLADGVSLAVLPLTLTVPGTAAPPAAGLTEKLEVFSVELVIASEKLAVTVEFNAISVAAFVGNVEATVGGVVSGAAPVVKFQLKSLVSALPAASVTPAATVAVYCVLGTKVTDGTNVAVLPLTLTVPATAVPCAVVSTLKLVVFSVVLVIASEKVAEIDEFVATPFAAFAGEVEDTVGGVVSEAAPVVKRQVKLAASALPVASLAALVMVAVYCVVAARLTEGTIITVLLPVITVPASGVPPEVGLSVKLAEFNVDLVIVSEKVADTEEFLATPVSAFDGEVPDTAGGDVSTNVAGDVTAKVSGVASSPPPPQPDKLRLANKARVNRQ